MNPQNPTPGIPAAPPVSTDAAMASVIGQLPPAPPDPVISFDAPPDPNVDPAPMFTPPAPAAPPAPQYPVPAPMPTGAPVAPPVAPVAPPPIDPNAIPIGLPPAPVPAEQAPLTADQIRQIVAEAVAGNVAGAPAAPAAPPADWTPNDWSDVEARIQQVAREQLQTGLTQAQAADQAAVEAENKARTDADAYIDNQVTQLVQTGYLPPISNAADPNDQGRLARQELFSYALSLGTDNLSAVAPNLYALHQNGYYYDRMQNKLVRRGSTSAAAQAPIAGASPTLAPAAPTGGLTMRDLATKDLHSIAADAASAYPLAT